MKLPRRNFLHLAVPPGRLHRAMPTNQNRQATVRQSVRNLSRYSFFLFD
jgi:hypothetical protein